MPYVDFSPLIALPAPSNSKLSRNSKNGHLSLIFEVGRMSLLHYDMMLVGFTWILF